MWSLKYHHHRPWPRHQKSHSCQFLPLYFGNSTSTLDHCSTVWKRLGSGTWLSTLVKSNFGYHEATFGTSRVTVSFKKGTGTWWASMKAAISSGECISPIAAQLSSSISWSIKPQSESSDILLFDAKGFQPKHKIWLVPKRKPFITLSKLDSAEVKTRSRRKWAQNTTCYHVRSRN